MHPTQKRIMAGLCLAWILAGAAPPALISKEVKMQEQQSGTWTPGLSNEEQQTLFAIAKDTLDWCVHKKKGPFPMESYQLTPKLKIPTATFRDP